MDLSNLKNIDVNDLFNKLKSGGLADKKLLIKFGIGFGAVLIFLIIYSGLQISLLGTLLYLTSSIIFLKFTGKLNDDFKVL